MNNKGIVKNMISHMKENTIYLFISLFFIFTGVVIGVYVAKYMGDAYKDDIINYFLSFVKDFNVGSINKTSILLQSVKNNGLMILFIVILGITIVGIPIIFFINLLKGFTVGFTAGIIINSLGIKGGTFILIALIPQNIFFLVAIIIATALSTEFGLYKLRSKMVKSYTIKAEFTSLYPLIVVLIIMVMIGAILEAYAIPNLIPFIV